MGYRWIYSTFFRLVVLAGGTVLLTFSILQGSWWAGITGGMLCVLAAWLSYRMQQQLREKCWLMLEAIRNRDYSFRLPLYGFSGGERVLQETLNQFSSDIIHPKATDGKIADLLFSAKPENPSRRTVAVNR